MQSEKYCIYFINTIKSPKKFTTVQSGHCNSGRKYDCNKPKTFYFDYAWDKNVDDNLKHEIEFIIKSNESLAENIMKNEIEQLLSKYKHANNIHEHGKQQNE